jgi:hypothetical protein
VPDRVDDDADRAEAPVSRVDGGAVMFVRFTARRSTSAAYPLSQLAI